MPLGLIATLEDQSIGLGRFTYADCWKALDVCARPQTCTRWCSRRRSGCSADKKIQSTGCGFPIQL